MDFDDQEDHEEDLSGFTPVTTPFSSPSLPSPLPNSSKAPLDHPNPVGGSASANRRNPRYRECLKNHAVGIGGHAVDGCGEFMPAGEEGTLDALKCAACNCHRNFHRKDPDGAFLLGEAAASPFHSHHHPQFSPYYRTPVGYLHHHLARAPPAPLALPSTSGGGGSRDDEELSDPVAAGLSSGGAGSSKKRFRTKFTQEQKDGMLGLAERLGWRIQKHDEAVVQQFCTEIGVKRHVLKVWMHNNKHTLGKKP